MKSSAAPAWKWRERERERNREADRQRHTLSGCPSDLFAEGLKRMKSSAAPSFTGTRGWRGSIRLRERETHTHTHTDKNWWEKNSECKSVVLSTQTHRYTDTHKHTDTHRHRESHTHTYGSGQTLTSWGTPLMSLGVFNWNTARQGDTHTDTRRQGKHTQNGDTQREREREKERETHTHRHVRQWVDSNKLRHPTYVARCVKKTHKRETHTDRERETHTHVRQWANSDKLRHATHVTRCVQRKHASAIEKFRGQWRLIFIVQNRVKWAEEVRDICSCFALV